MSVSSTISLTGPTNLPGGAGRAVTVIDCQGGTIYFTSTSDGDALFEIADTTPNQSRTFEFKNCNVANTGGADDTIVIDYSGHQSNDKLIWRGGGVVENPTTAFDQLLITANADAAPRDIIISDALFSLPSDDDDDTNAAYIEATHDSTMYIVLADVTVLGNAFSGKLFDINESSLTNGGNMAWVRLDNGEYFRVSLGEFDDAHVVLSNPTFVDGIAFWDTNPQTSLPGPSWAVLGKSDGSEPATLTGSAFVSDWTNGNDVATGGNFIQVNSANHIDLRFVWNESLGKSPCNESLFDPNVTLFATPAGGLPGSGYIRRIDFELAHSDHQSTEGTACDFTGRIVSQAILDDLTSADQYVRVKLLDKEWQWVDGVLTQEPLGECDYVEGAATSTDYTGFATSIGQRSVTRAGCFIDDAADAAAIQFRHKDTTTVGDALTCSENNGGEATSDGAGDRTLSATLTVGTGIVPGSLVCDNGTAGEEFYDDGNGGLYGPALEGDFASSIVDEQACATDQNCSATLTYVPVRDGTITGTTTGGGGQSATDADSDTYWEGADVNLGDTGGPHTDDICGGGASVACPDLTVPPGGICGVNLDYFGDTDGDLSASEHGNIGDLTLSWEEDNGECGGSGCTVTCEGYFTTRASTGGGATACTGSGISGTNSVKFLNTGANVGCVNIGQNALTGFQSGETISGSTGTWDIPDNEIDYSTGDIDLPWGTDPSAATLVDYNAESIGTINYASGALFAFFDGDATGDYTCTFMDGPGLAAIANITDEVFMTGEPLIWQATTATGSPNVTVCVDRP